MAITTPENSTFETMTANHSMPKSKQTKPEMIDLILECLDDAKAEDTVSIDMEGKSPMSDYMVVTTGRSHRHVGAVADQIARALKAQGFGNARIEGLTAGDWVLLDAGDVIVHIFRPEVREFYNIEKMWLAEMPPVSN